MLKYTVSPRTQILFGMQGIPGFEFQYTDFVQSQNDYKQKIYSLQLQNQSIYFGYTILLMVGYEFDEFRYEEEYRQFEQYRTSSTYVRMYLGW